MSKPTLHQSLSSAVCLVLLVACAACSGTSHKDSAGDKSSGPAAAIQTTSHDGVGVIKALNPSLPSIEIDHEDIKGLMPAMQMEFHVKDKTLLNGLGVNDRIQFTVENGVHGMLITAIKKL